MKIGIDARMLGPRCGGLGRYVQQLVENLKEIDSENQYVLFLKKDNFDEVSVGRNFKKVLADIHWYGWEEQIKFNKIIKKEKVDLMHFPHWNVPLLYNDPFVVTIHDLLLLHHPTREASKLGWLTYWFKQFVYKKVLAHAVKKAKHIITPSLFTKMDVSKTLNIPQNKITVTYEAPFHTNGVDNIDNDKSILEKFGITKQYVLYVGVAYPHKNLKGLLRAWKLIEDKVNDYQLVLVGKKNFFYEQLMQSDEVKECKNVIFTDFVEDNTLSSLYKNARLYVFPSLYEGFGLPTLEAMSYGIPVVSSNRTCLPEVLGEGALYADPEDAHYFSHVIETGLNDENVRFEIKQKADLELKRYSWRKMSVQTLEVYNK